MAPVLPPPFPGQTREERLAEIRHFQRHMARHSPYGYPPSGAFAIAAMALAAVFLALLFMAATP